MTSNTDKAIIPPGPSAAEYATDPTGKHTGHLLGAASM